MTIRSPPKNRDRVAVQARSSVEEAVGAETARERVRASAAGQRVVAGFAVEAVGCGTAGQAVGPGARRKACRRAHRRCRLDVVAAGQAHVAGDRAAVVDDDDRSGGGSDHQDPAMVPLLPMVQMPAPSQPTKIATSAEIRPALRMVAGPKAATPTPVAAPPVSDALMSPVLINVPPADSSTADAPEPPATSMMPSFLTVTPGRERRCRSHGRWSQPH